MITQPLKDARSPIGGSVILTAKVKAFPTPDVVWVVNGQPVEENEKFVVQFEKPTTYTLTMNDVPEDLNASQISFTAKNVAGEVNSTAKLTVSGRVPEFVVKPFKCTVLEGATYTKILSNVYM